MKDTDVGWVDCMAALRDANHDFASLAILTGFHVPGDGGEGIFAWDSSISARQDDGGTVIHSDNVRGRGGWRRLYSGPLNVCWFGAKGDNSGDQREAIQKALDLIDDGGAVYFPSGTYRIAAKASRNNLKKGLHCLGRNRIRIFGDHARIRAAGEWDDRSAIMNLSGTGNSHVHGLQLFATADLTHPPAAGLVVGRRRNRNASSNYLENVFISGPFRTGCLYNCCHEGLVALRCRFKNLADCPAYFDSSEDVNELTELVTVSNVTKTFHSCSFSSTTSLESSSASHIVRLHGNQQSIRFRDCFFSFIGGQGAVFLMQDEDRQTKVTRNLIIDGSRVERNKRGKERRYAEDQSNTRLIRYAKGSRLSGVVIRGLAFKVRSEGIYDQPVLIEVTKGGLERSTIEVIDCEGLACIIRASAGVPVVMNELAVPAAGMIDVADADAGSNLILQVEDSGGPFTGLGAYSDNKVLVPAVEQHADSTADTVAGLRSDFNGLLAKLRASGVLGTGS